MPCCKSPNQCASCAALDVDRRRPAHRNAPPKGIKVSRDYLIQVFVPNLAQGAPINVGLFPYLNGVNFYGGKSVADARAKLARHPIKYPCGARVAIVRAEQSKVHKAGTPLNYEIEVLHA